MIDPERYSSLGEGLRTCPACGYRCPESYHYCPACGAAMLDGAPLPPPERGPSPGRRALALAAAFVLGILAARVLGG